MSDTLSSDILEKQFGPTTVAVLAHGTDRRVISTLAGGRALEFSLVMFKREASATFPGVHRDIAAGMSMGKAFRGRGIPFKRTTRTVHSYELPVRFARRFGGSGAATVLEVSIAAGKGAVPYADILEVYAPAVDWPESGPPAQQKIKDGLGAFDKLLTDLGH